MKACGNSTNEFMHWEPLSLSCNFSQYFLFYVLYLNTQHLPYQKQFSNFWGCFNGPSFTHTLHAYQHVSLYLRHWAETTAACLITFPLTEWSHSRPVVLLRGFRWLLRMQYVDQRESSLWSKSPVTTTVRSVLHQRHRLCQCNVWMRSS